MSERRIVVDPTACEAHGLCAELLRKLITLDEGGHPVLIRSPVPQRLERIAKLAVRACPTLALTLGKHCGPEWRS